MVEDLLRTQEIHESTTAEAAGALPTQEIHESASGGAGAVGETLKIQEIPKAADAGKGLPTQQIVDGPSGETDTLESQEIRKAEGVVPSGRTATSQAHRRRMRQWAHQQARPEAQPRGWPGQCQRRRLETEVRQEVLQVCHFALDLGLSTPEVASRLGLPPRTLRDWDERARHDRLQPRPRGRPVLRSPRQQRQQVLDFLAEIGPAVGLPTLQASFPELPRAELRDLLGRYRRVWRTRYHSTIQVLEWTQPGRVWALDFAEPPCAIDNTWPYLLAVRDLASGQQLLWLPVADETAATVVRELELLFTRHGAPLVLKADNGSAFVAGALKRLACVWGVHLLYSPAWRPSYNGAIEAGIGALKTRTHWQAAHAGHPEIWTSADVEAARQQANELARPRGAHGGSPDLTWQARAPMGEQERARFQSTVTALVPEARRGLGLTEAQELTHKEESTMMREAIRRALVAHDLLLFRRRRIPLPILRRTAARIT